jgi:beta-phosphoglucomutase-like phosphatase (HAD superfamily)
MNINNYDLFIFDLDDTLIKTEYYHYISWKTILNTDFDYNYYISKFHSNKNDNIKHFLINDLKINNYDELIQKKNIFYINYINDNYDKIKMIDGTCELLEYIIKKNKKFVIVSNSPKEQIDFFCNLFPILQKSSKNYYREMFINRKPHPECYLKVIDDFPNTIKIGFEDSITGIHSITQVKEITTVFINTIDYFYYEFINKNYDIEFKINSFYELLQ